MNPQAATFSGLTNKMIKLKANTKSISAKLQALREGAEEAALGKVLNAAQDAVQASPVDTGAFVESWSIVPKGSGAGRSKSSKTPARRAVSGKLSASQKQAIREKHKNAIAGDLSKFREQILNLKGATITNRAPHGKHMQPRNGMTLNKILMYVVDRNS